MSWWGGREVCCGSSGNVQLLKGNLCLSRSLHHSLRAPLPRSQGGALWKPSREQEELPELCLIQDHIQDNFPGHLMLSRSQALPLHPKIPHLQAEPLPEVSSERLALPVVQQPLPPPAPVQPLQHLHHLLQLA